MAESKRGQYPSAKASLTAALALAPGASPVLAELVRVCIEMAEFEAAIEHARTLVKVEGERGHELGLLGKALAASGRKDEARSVLTRAVHRGASTQDVDDVTRLLDAVPAEVTRPSVVHWLKRIFPASRDRST